MYRWKRRLWYYRSALSRHGVHSPFVYTFAEQLLKGFFREQVPAIKLSYPFPDEKFRQLVLKMTVFYHCSGLEVREGDRSQTFPLQPDIPGQFRVIRLFPIADCPQELPGGPGVILILTGIRRDEAAEQLWISLREQPELRLSIDLFDMGLLFFEEDFLVKQHFLLRF